MSAIWYLAKPLMTLFRESTHALACCDCLHTFDVTQGASTCFHPDCDIRAADKQIGELIYCYAELSSRLSRRTMHSNACGFSSPVLCAEFGSQRTDFEVDSPLEFLLYTECSVMAVWFITAVDRKEYLAIFPIHILSKRTWCDLLQPFKYSECKTTKHIYLIDSEFSSCGFKILKKRGRSKAAKISKLKGHTALVQAQEEGLSIAKGIQLVLSTNRFFRNTTQVGFDSFVLQQDAEMHALSTAIGVQHLRIINDHIYSCYLSC